MPPPSLTERNRIKAFVEQTGRHVSPSPQKNRHVDRSPDTIYTDNLESLNIVEANMQYTKAPDDVTEENTRPPSVQSVDDRRLARIDHLFDGSELPEGFMRSGRSTPTSDYSDRVPVKYLANGAHNAQFKKPSRLIPDTINSLPALAVESDFQISVVTGQQRSNVADMKDGFSATAITHNNARHPPSPIRRGYHQLRKSNPHMKQQMREARASIPRLEDEDRGRAKSQARYTAHSPLFNGSDDDSGSVHGREGHQMTPQGKPLSMRNRAQQPPSPAKPRIDRKRRHKSPDYDDQALDGMTFQDLVQQPFDFDPATATMANNPVGAEGDGDQKWSQMQHVSSAEQQQFFAKMSVAEWESAGVWFSERFSGIMLKLTAARQTKRHIVDGFEKEAAAREAEVRRRSNKIDEKLQKMREDGLKVVGGKG